MAISLGKLSTHPSILKATAVILGYLFWSIAAHSFSTTLWISVPVAFYNATDKTLAAPEIIQVQLQAKRLLLAYLDTTKLAVHINADTLHEGEQQLPVTHEHLMIPSTISILQTDPTNLIITCKKNQL